MPGITPLIHQLKRDLSLSTVITEVLILTEYFNKRKPNETTKWLNWFLKRGDTK